MNRVKIHILSLKGSKIFQVDSENYAGGELVRDFLKIFAYEIVPCTTNLTIELQKYDPNLREKINEFVEKYRDSEPKIYQVNTYFKKFEDGELFFVVPTQDIPLDIQISLLYHLNTLKNGEDSKAVFDKFLSKDFLSQYAVSVFSENTKQSIGELDKQKRICRFCDKMMPETRFGAKAHAIPEALGNKVIISNEECDVCNNTFGSGIERDLINYLDIIRCFLGVKGKNGLPKLKGKNFELSHMENPILKYVENGGIDDFPKSTIKLETSNSLNSQNIYKALCKILLSVVNVQELHYLKKTIQWINGTIETSNLPKIAVLNSSDLFTLHPQLRIYSRISERCEIPHLVGELRFTYLVLAYIIPYSNKDTKTFTSEADYDIFWQQFQHYNSKEGWSFESFDDNVSRRLNFEIEGFAKTFEGRNFYKENDEKLRR